MDIIEQIKTDFSTYNKTRKRIASYILDNPTKCCFLTLHEFARETQSTEVTVLNFCRFLGQERYIEFRKALQSHMLKWTRPVDRMKELGRQNGNWDELIKEIVKSEMKALKQTFEHNGPEQIRDFINLIRKAKRVFVAAHGISRLFSIAICHRLTLLGVDINSLDMDNPQKTIFRLLGCVPEDNLLIAISTPPYGKNTLATARMCLSRKIPVAAITDSPFSPLASMAEASLICPTELMGMTNSPTSIMAMIDVIAILFMADQKEIESQQQKTAADQYEEYLRLFTTKTD